MSVKGQSSSFVTIPTISVSESLALTPTHFSDVNSIDDNYFHTSTKISGDISLNIRPFYNRYFFHSLFGSEVSGSTYYEYKPSLNNSYISLRVDETSSNTSFLTTLYDTCYVDSISLNMKQKEFVVMGINWTAYDYDTSIGYASSPPYDYVEELPLVFYKIDVEMASGVASLTDVALKDLKLSFDRNSIDEQYINSLLPEERFNNGSFIFKGDMTFDSDEYDHFSYQLKSQTMIDVEFKIILYDINNVKKIEIYYPSINFISTNKKIDKQQRTKTVSFITKDTGCYVRIYKTE